LLSGTAFSTMDLMPSCYQTKAVAATKYGATFRCAACFRA